MRRCDELVKGDDPIARWESAVKLLGGKKGKLFGGEKPEWNDPLPKHLWSQGTGQCTSFSVAINQLSGIGAEYVEYQATHRLANKIDSQNSALIIDSGRTYAFQLDSGKQIENWENRDGKVYFQSGNKSLEPMKVTSHEEAMKLCLDQLFRKGRYLLILHRGPVVDGCGTWGAITMFSAFHRALKLQEPTQDGLCRIQYLVFGQGGTKDLDVRVKHLDSQLELLLSVVAGEDVGFRLRSEVQDIVAQSSKLWGNPRLSLVETLENKDGKTLRLWPVARFEEL
jgi:hypothetical protein